MKLIRQIIKQNCWIITTFVDVQVKYLNLKHQQINNDASIITAVSSIFISCRYLHPLVKQ